MAQQSSTPAWSASSSSGSTARLNTRDLINAGIFAALYFVITFVSGMIGFGLSKEKCVFSGRVAVI
ncbi:MptD family putative ECF transporter S component [Corynebacterium macclintockiae]|uniref:MptD family putative ECF transporter S component n=1 Tax=Corynebacterium macclintockiae TaxID=2913501 RepID=UPI003EBE2D61